jgi:hypothetical protein
MIEQRKNVKNDQKTRKNTNFDEKLTFLAGFEKRGDKFIIFQ